MKNQYVITRLPDGISLNAGHSQVLRKNGSNKIAYFTLNKAIQFCNKYGIDTHGILLQKNTMLNMMTDLHLTRRNNF